MAQAKLVRILLLAAAALLLVAGLVYRARQEVQVVNELSRARDTAPDLAGLHRQAATGALRMLGPQTLEDALIAGGFPPRRPVPRLAGRARLQGGALADAGRQTVALAHFVANEGRFTLFTVPAKAELLPEDAAAVVRGGAQLRIVRRGEVTIVFWTAGAWTSALATEMPAGDRDLFVDLVRQAQGG